jgi:hypothetical protein
MQNDRVHRVNSMDDFSGAGSTTDIRETLQHLQFIVALLVEKNERMRQQLVAHTVESECDTAERIASQRWLGRNSSQ